MFLPQARPDPVRLCLRGACRSASRTPSTTVFSGPSAGSAFLRGHSTYGFSSAVVQLMSARTSDQRGRQPVPGAHGGHAGFRAGDSGGAGGVGSGGDRGAGGTDPTGPSAVFNDRGDGGGDGAGGCGSHSGINCYRRLSSKWWRRSRSGRWRRSRFRFFRHRSLRRYRGRCFQG